VSAEANPGGLARPVHDETCPIQGLKEDSMTTSQRTGLSIGVILVMTAGVVLASGGTGTPAPKTTTPTEDATGHYERGLQFRDKAWALEEKAAAEDESQSAKLRAKATKQYEKAAEEFVAATRLNARYHQAYSDLGYVLRQTGKYEDALRAYDRALSLSPEYVEAIEYRGEAYLGLDRVDDAKRAYMRLFGADRAKADEMMAAMKKWLERRRRDGGDLDPAVIESFGAWVVERDELASQTATVSELESRTW